MLHSQFDHAIGHLTRVIAGHGYEYACEGILVFFHQLAYHSKVKDDDRAILTHEYIAGMRVTVKISKLKYHGQVYIHAPFYYDLRIYAPFGQLVHIGDLAAFDELHDKYLVSRVFAIYFWYIEVCTEFICRAKPLNIPRFIAVIQFFLHTALKGAHCLICL